jgi:hypothetical protein
MTNSHALIYFIFMIGFGILALYGAIRNYFTLKNFKTNLVDVAHAQEKYVTLEGKAKQYDELFEAPLSKQKCLGYFYRVVDKSGRKEKTIFTKTNIKNFILEDTTGKCLIVGADNIKFNAGKLSQNIFFSDEKYPENAIVKNDLLNKTGILSRKKYKYYEYCVQIDDVICAQGQFQRITNTMGLKGNLIKNENEPNKMSIIITGGNKNQVMKDFIKNIILFSLLTVLCIAVSSISLYLKKT